MKDIFQSINKKEWLFVLTAALVLIAVTTLPLVYGYIIKPEDKFFPAIHSTGAGDFSVYYSYIGQAKEGQLIFNDLFTSEEHSPFIFNPFWLIVGLSARLFGLSAIAAYQISRILLIIVFCFVLYFFMSYFIKEIKFRRLGYFFMVFASGLGGYFIPLIRNIYHNQISLKNYPMDLWVSEGYSFLTLYHSPHFILATILIISALFLMYYSFLKGKWIYTLLAGLMAGFLIFFHPFHFPTLLAVPLAYIFVRSFKNGKIRVDYFKKYLVFVFFMLPASLYHFLILIYNPVAAGRAELNVCLTPYWWVVVISYGLILPFALWGLIKKRKSGRFVFIATWALVQFALIFSPLDFQRRMTQGLQIPLALLAFWGLYAFYESVNKKIQIKRWLSGPLIILIMILFFGFSNLYVLAEDLILYSDSKYRKEPEYIYLDQAYNEAFSWLAERTAKQAVILGDHIPSHFASGFALKISYLSHWAETLDFWEKRDKFLKFFQTETDEQWRRDFLAKEGIDYLLYTPFEKRHGGYNPAQSAYLSLVFKKGEVEIYQIL